jgi:hypothetical protein
MDTVFFLRHEDFDFSGVDYLFNIGTSWLEPTLLALKQEEMRFVGVRFLHQGNILWLDLWAFRSVERSRCRSG